MHEHKQQEVSTMTVDDLRQRRQALETQLSALREQREHAARTNSYARSRQRIGVTAHTAVQMQEFADDQIAGESAMTDLRRQIELIDDELSRSSGGGLIGRGRRMMSRRK
jgi:hypothetical protein